MKKQNTSEQEKILTWVLVWWNTHWKFLMARKTQVLMKTFLITLLSLLFVFDLYNSSFLRVNIRGGGGGSPKVLHKHYTHIFTEGLLSRNYHHMGVLSSYFYFYYYYMLRWFLQLISCWSMKHLECARVDSWKNGLKPSFHPRPCASPQNFRVRL